MTPEQYIRLLEILQPIIIQIAGTPKGSEATKKLAIFLEEIK